MRGRIEVTQPKLTGQSRRWRARGSVKVPVGGSLPPGPLTHLRQVLRGGDRGHTTLIDWPVLECEGSADT
jgi:hypothetical protein